MSETVQIKPYEPIDDQYLTKMVAENLFQTQNFSTRMIIDGAIGRYGAPKIALALFVIYSTLYMLMISTGFESLHAQVATIILMLSAFGLFCGIIFPKKMLARSKIYQTQEITKEFSDIRGNFMGPGKCLWIATIKPETNNAKEKIVGCVLVEPYDAKKDYMGIMKRPDIKGKVAQLRRMSVDPSMRRMGIGRKLVSELKTFCQKNGYAAVALTTLSSNRTALEAYKKSGFEFYRKIPCMHTVGVPFTTTCLVMKL